MGWSTVLVLLVAVAPDLGASPQMGKSDCRVNPHVNQARQFYAALEFDLAAQTLQRAMEYSGNCRSDLAEIWRLKASIDSINGDQQRCRRNFEVLLALQPEARVPLTAPPKIRDCFATALETPASERRVALEHRSPGGHTPQTPVVLDIRLEDPLRLVDHVNVYFRREGVEIYTVVRVPAAESLSAVIPGLALPAAAAGYVVEYKLRALDRFGGILARLGSDRRPLVFDVSPMSGGGAAIVEQWWFWTVLGVALAGASVGAAVAMTSGGDTLTLSIRDGGTADGP